jgi:putative sterol carrier protein
MAQFPTPGWAEAIKNKLNSDDKYAKIAAKWEGDMLVEITPSGGLTQTIYFYFDLWHGKCKSASMTNEFAGVNPAFKIIVPYLQVVDVLNGKLEVMQAILTRKISIQGNMVVIMRNVPTVIDFIRCCREVTSEILF